MPQFKKGDIKPNPKYLKEWDDYQLDWLNSPEFTPRNKKRPLLLPVSVSIEDGKIARSRISVPKLEALLGKIGDLGGKKARLAIDSYVKFFEPIDSQQSSTPPSPLDFKINTPVMMLFHLPRENWVFTDHTQFSVSNIRKKHHKKAYKVIGTFDDGCGLMVLNKCWQNKKGEVLDMKYNLHVSIMQTELVKSGDEYVKAPMRTDIIIDPSTNNDTKGPPTGPPGGSGGPPGGG